MIAARTRRTERQGVGVRPTAARASWLTIALGTFTAALVVRLVAIATVYQWVDSDQAVLGLMARHILQGARPVFYAAQSYNGALEAYLTALPVAMWGATDLTIRLVPATLSAAFAALCAVLATRLSGRLVGILTGFFLALGPPLLIRWTTAAGAGYVEPLLLGTLLLAIAGGAPWPDMRSASRTGVLGLALGLGLWADPLIVPYVLTLGAVILPALRWGHVRLSPRAALTLAVGTLVGLAPVLVTEGPRGLLGLVGLDRAASAQGDWLLIHLVLVHRLVTEAGPVLLGTIRPGIDPGEFASEVARYGPFHVCGVLLTLLIVVALVAPRGLPATARRVAAGAGELSDLLLLVLPITVLVFFLSPYGAMAWTTREPRYLLPLYTATGTVLALLLALRPRHHASGDITTVPSRIQGALHQRNRRPLLVAVSCFVVAGLVILNLTGLSREHVDSDVRPLTTLLLGRGTEVVFADYWLTYRMTFETGERLLGVTIWDDGSVGPYRVRNRFPAYVTRALTARHVAWVVPAGSPEASLRTLLAAHHARARRTTWGGFAVYTDITPPVVPPDLAIGGTI